MIQRPTQAGGGFQGAAFSHAGLESTCIGCHLNDRPTGVVKSYLHTYSIHGKDDCVECHNNPGTTWSGAYHQHSPFVGIQCAQCHVNDRPQAANYPDGSVVLGHFGTQDCVDCHLPQLNTTPIPFTYTHVDVFNNTTKTCLPCHTQQGITAHGDKGDCVSCHGINGNWMDATSSTPTPAPSGSPTSIPSPAPTPDPSATPLLKSWMVR